MYSTSSPINVNIYYDSTNKLHRDISYHPEQPSRIDACIDALRKEYRNLNGDVQDGKRLRVQLFDVASTTKSEIPDGDDDDDDGSIVRNYPFTATELDHARNMLVLAHSKDYVENIEIKCRNSKQRRIEEGKEPLGFIGYVDDGDTYLTTESFDVLLRATAAWIRAVNVVMESRTNEDGDTEATKCTAAAMALTRPPGHHATSTTANGFCVFNFAAAAALHAIESKLTERVSVLDWDVHYGQGVADILQHYDSARYVSMHQYPAFPYLGEKKGLSGSKRNILTVPLPPDSTWTCGYSAPYHEHVLPYVFEKNVWEPDLVIICSGYDALNSDELASCGLNAADYGQMTRLLRERIAGGGGKSTTGNVPALVFGLEGGYQLKEGAGGGNLQEAVLETLKALA